MYLAASPDAWDLLWTFPDVPVASTSLSVPSKPVVVHRVASTDPIPHHVNTSKCRPFGTSKPIVPQLVGAFTYGDVTEAVLVGCGDSANLSDIPARYEVDAGHKTSRSLKRLVHNADENDGAGQESHVCFIDTVTSSMKCHDILDGSGDAAPAPTSSVNSLTSRSSVQSVTTLDGDGDGRRVGAENANPKEDETTSIAGDRQHNKSVSADSRHDHLLVVEHAVGDRSRELLPSTELSDGSETSGSSRSVLSIGAGNGTGGNSSGRIVLASCQAAAAATLAARNEMGRWTSLDVITDGRGVSGTAMYGNGDPIDRAKQSCPTASEEPHIAVTAGGVAAAAATWDSESLRQFCRNRDPRRQCFLERQQQQQQQPGGLGVSEQQRQQYWHQCNFKTHIPTAISLSPPPGELRTLLGESSRVASDATPPPAGRVVHALAGAAGGGPAGKTSLTATIATGATTDPVAAYTGITCAAAMSPSLQQRQRLQLQHPAVRRGPRTTTALLLSKVRSGVAAAAAPAVITAARVDRDFDACDAVRVRGSEWRPRRTTAGCYKKRVSGGGSTRRATEGIGKVRSRKVHPMPGLAVYDGDMEDSLELEESSFSSDSSSGGWGGLRCATTAAVTAAMTAKPHGRFRTSLLDEVQRALAAAAVANADTDVADVAAAATAAVGGGLQRRTAWRLPPLLRGRFDFSTARRRGSQVAAVARGGRGLDLGAAEDRAEKGGGPLSRPKAVGVDQEGFRGGGNGAASAGPSAGHTLAEPPGTGSRSSSSGGDGGSGGSGGSPALALLQALDAWRTHRARSVRKTPEALLRLGLLADLAARCPTSVLQLEDFPGLPRPFTRRYGQEVLDICRNHAHLRASRAAAAAAAAAAAVGAAGGGEIGGPRTYVSTSGGGGGGGSVAAAFGQMLAEEAADAANRAPRRSSSDEDDDADGGVLKAQVDNAAQGCGESAGGTAEDAPVGVATADRPAGPSEDVAPCVWRMRQQLLNILGVQEGDDGRPPRATMPHRHLAPSSAAAAGGGVVANNVCYAVGVGGSSKPASVELAARGQCGNADTQALGGSGGVPGNGNRGGREVAPSYMCHVSGRRAASPPPSYPSAGVRNVVARAAAASASNGDIVGAGIAEGVDTKREIQEGIAAAAAAAAVKSAAGASSEATADAAAAATRSAGKRLTPDGGGIHRLSPGKARKCGPADSPRHAATAAGMVDLGAARAASAGETVPAGWSPLPEGCRARSGRRLALASTPSLNGAKVKCLLGYLAEAGTAAAPLLEAIVPHPVLPGNDGGSTSAPSSSAAAVSTGAAAAAAVVPAAAVAMATAAHRLGRIGGQEQLRQLRGLVEAAMPAWEVRRVLSCRALGPAAQAVAVLRLEYGASRDSVRLAFRRLSLLVHPDKNRSSGAADAFALVSAAASRLLGGQQQKHQ
ncbi:hypothetical protein Vafri_17997 [Volvox africanus]|uniref:J domain-containing protein n=1 Tax=Volvox africanus TaxID=51714 RepID=A0A8J4F878_9CHLO|nr:hypothetical protein Vafri_17997 [Volvox africanus]